MKYVYDTKEVTRYRFPTHFNNLVMDRSESNTSEVFVVVIEPGKAPPLHKHDDTEQVFYITEGAGSLEIQGEDEQFKVKPGDIVRVPPTIFHTIHCEGEENLVYIAVDCFMGGRPEAEPTWDSHVQVMCKEQGFDYDTVRD